MMAHRLEVLRYGKWEPRGSYPSVLEAQAHAPRGQYRIVEDVPQETVSHKWELPEGAISISANMAHELVDVLVNAVDSAVAKATPKKRAPRKAKTAGKKVVRP